MYEERLLAVGLYDIGFGNTGLEIEDIVGIVLEGFENSYVALVMCDSTSVLVRG